MSEPKLTLSEREEVAFRYEAGETIPHIAEAYGVYGSLIHRVLKKQGVQCRSASEAAKKVRTHLRECRECSEPIHPNAKRDLCPPCARWFCWDCDQKLKAPSPPGSRRECSLCKFKRRWGKRPPRLCRICGRIGARGTRRDLCAVHIKQFCRDCEAHMPMGRVNARCTLCSQKHKEKLYARPDRRCAQCGEREVTAHASRCAHCLHEEYEVRRLQLMHLSRPCSKCGQAMPQGRERSRCPACEREAAATRRRELMAVGAHRCGLCGAELSLKQSTYCSGCLNMLAKWRAAWHAGNQIARQLGTVREIRRWQEREKGDADANSGSDH